MNKNIFPVVLALSACSIVAISPGCFKFPPNRLHPPSDGRNVGGPHSRDTGAGDLHCGTPALTDEGVFLHRVWHSYDAAEGWLTNNLREKGLFRYIYHPKTDEYPNKNNAVRQLMASRLLAELASENPDLIPMHRRNLAFLFRYWYKEKGNVAYIDYDNKSSVGANAMMLRTLVWSPLYDVHQKQAKRLAGGILSLMNERGAFHPWFKEPDYEYDKDYLLTFYSGEALVALIEYHNKSGSLNCLDAAVRSQDYYIQQYVTEMDKHYYPAYVPWHSISLNLLWKITGKQKYANAIFALNEKLLEIQDRTDEVGRFYNPRTPQYGTPHSSSDGVYTEGLAYAYEVARLTGDKKREQTYDRAIRMAVNNLVTLQYDDATAAQYRHPDRAIGALKYRRDASGIRIDTTQHAMDAYRKIIQLLGGTRRTIVVLPAPPLG